MAQHRKIKESRPAHRVGAALVVGGVTVTAAALSNPASAAPVSTWDKVADCESSGDWKINTGNGYYGGLQFSRSTWSAYKLSGYPSRADLASKSQQIIVAERVLKAQGPGAWPTCGARAGLIRGGPAPALAPARPRTPPAASSSTRAARAVAYAVSKISSAPYAYGGNGPTRFDCSGLTSQAWKHAGVQIPRTAAGQLQGLPRVSLSSVRPGDLVVYTFRSYADHVAIYAGSGRTVDTASHHINGGVGYSKLHRAGGTIAGVVRPGGSAERSQPRTAEPQAVQPKVQPRVRSASTSTSVYRVKPGDTLSAIARAYGQRSWQSLYALNRDRVRNPHLIYPGQVLRLQGPGVSV